MIGGGMRQFNFSKSMVLSTALAMVIWHGLSARAWGQDQNVNALFTEKKVKNYLPHMSSHHMGFPGTITLTPETFEAVVYETALSLIEHGFRKILIYNGHGGNTASVANVTQ